MRGTPAQTPAKLRPAPAKSCRAVCRTEGDIEAVWPATPVAVRAAVPTKQRPPPQQPCTQGDIDTASFEVFDLADGDDPVAGWLGEDSVHKAPRSALRKEMTSCSDATTYFTEMTATAAGDEADAWALDDWTSQASESRHSSPCNVVRQLNGKQCETLSDLQLDVQAQVQLAIQEMSSWISEEISFARQGFQEEISFARQGFQEEVERANNDALDSVRAEQLAIKNGQAEINSQVSSIRASLEEQMQALTLRIGDLDAKNCKTEMDFEALTSRVGQLDAKSCATEMDSEVPLQSSLQKEIQALTLRMEQSDANNFKAEVDLKVASLQASLEKQTQALYKLQEESCSWAQPSQPRLSVTSGGGPQPSAHVLEATRMAEERKWRLKLDQFQDALDKQSERIEIVDSHQQHLMQKVTAHDLDCKHTSTSVSALEARLNKREKDHMTVKGSLDSCVQKVEACVNGSIRTAERLTKHDDELSKVAEGLTTHDSEISRLAERLTKHDDDISRVGDGLTSHNAEAKRVAATLTTHGSEMEAYASRISSMQTSIDSRLAVESTEHQRKLREHRQELDNHVGLIEMLDEKISGNSDVKRSLHKFAQKLEAFPPQIAMLVERAAALDSHMKEQSRQISGVDNKLSTKISGVDNKLSNSQKERLAELKVVCNRLEIHDSLLGSIPSELRDHVRNERDDIINIVRGMQEKLSQTVKCKASRSDLKTASEALHALVNDTHCSHRMMVESLESSVEQTRASHSQHGVVIETHQTWMNDLKTWMAELSSWQDRTNLREQVFNETLLHIVEEDHPNMMASLEKRLQDGMRAPK